MKFLFYKEFCDKRVHKIIDIFGKSWFVKKNILELGSAHGDVGIEFLKLGSNVIFNEIREENIKEIKKSLNHYNFNPEIFQHDLNTPFSFDKKFDLILNCSVLYLLENWKEHLDCCLKNTHYMILDSWVSPSPDLIDETLDSPKFEHGSFNGKTVNFTESTIEKFLKDKGVKFIRFDNSELSSSWVPMNDNKGYCRNLYDWTYENFNKGLYDNPDNELNYLTYFRRFWFIIT